MYIIKKPNFGSWVMIMNNTYIDGLDQYDKWLEYLMRPNIVIRYSHGSYIAMRASDMNVKMYNIEDFTEIKSVKDFIMLKDLLCTT